MARPSKLPKPAVELVLTSLKNEKRPLTAYEILDKLKKFGIKSPPIIYRALDELIKNGNIHKIKDLGAFIACDCAENHHHEISVLTICELCNKVEELHNNDLINQLKKLKNYGVNISSGAVIQFPILCKKCN